MIMTQTPFRISFFGGGTDYPAWFRDHGGAVLATTIDKFCYITCRKLPPFFPHKSRIVWSRIELVNAPEDIQHPAVRAALRGLTIDEGIELHHDADLPARSGIGSSSSFAVGVLHALHGLRGDCVSRDQLAQEAMALEQDDLKEHVGCQDQILATFGGFNRIDFWGERDFGLSPMLMTDRLRDLERHLMLVFTGHARTASLVAGGILEAMPMKTAELHRLREMVDEGQAILKGSGPLDAFGLLLHEAWQLKRSLAPGISLPEVDTWYERAVRAGCLGGKLLGAGGGGFMLLFVRPEHHMRVMEALDGLLRIPFAFESLGTRLMAIR